MLKGRLPDRIEPLALARDGVSLTGELDLAVMTRLADLLTASDGRVDVLLEFGVDPQGIRHIGGRIRAQVQMRCQRCLQPMTVVVDQPVSLGLAVGEEAAKQLPGHYEPLLVTGGPLSLTELVEEELLLALPIAPLHPQEQCPAAVPQVGDEEPGQEEERPNPFSALAHWKRQSD